MTLGARRMSLSQTVEQGTTSQLLTLLRALACTEKRYDYLLVSPTVTWPSNNKLPINIFFLLSFPWFTSMPKFNRSLNLKKRESIIYMAIH